MRKAAAPRGAVQDGEYVPLAEQDPASLGLADDR